MAFGTIIKSFANPRVNLFGLSFGGNNLISCDQFGTISVFDIRDGRELYIITGTLCIYLVTIGDYIIGGFPGVAVTEVRSKVSGILIRTFNRPDTGMGGLSFDGRNLWFAHGTNVSMIDMNTGANIKSLNIGVTPTGLEVADDRFWVTVDSDNTLREYDSNSGALLRSVATPAATPRDLAFDGSSLWHVDLGTDITYRISLD